MANEPDRIPGEYDEVVALSYQKNRLRQAHSLGITRKDAYDLIMRLRDIYLPGRQIEVVFGSSDRSTAYGASNQDGKMKIDFPAAFIRPGIGLRAGVVLHEFAHLMGNWDHAQGFTQTLDQLLYEQQKLWQKVYNPPEEEKPKSFSRVNKALCPSCGKVAQLKSPVTIRLAGKQFAQLVCGHMMVKEVMDTASLDILDSYEALDGSRLLPFQKEGIRFLETANGRAILNDEMGLGKTVQGIVFCQIHKERLGPFVVVCSASLIRQWARMIYNWTGGERRIQVFMTGSDMPLLGMQWYIISYDLLARVDETFFNFPFNTVILDEVQHIKNHNAKRTNNVRKLTMLKPFVIPMTGTLAKNNAAELFPACNIVAPELFPSRNRFINDFVWNYKSAYGDKFGGLKSPERWHEFTKNIIIRRTKKQVLTELPDKQRVTTFYDLDEELETQYLAILDQFIEAYENEKGSASFYNSMLAYLNVMRHITGLSKVPNVGDKILDYLEDTEEKALIFIHHHDVADSLEKYLNEGIKSRGITAKVGQFKSDMSPDVKDALQAEFNNPQSRLRVVIASTLAAGVGLNLQHACHYSVMMERQWNPPNEQQAEDRLHRMGQTKGVQIDYPLVLGTVDEFFTEVVEKKRKILGEINGDAAEWQEVKIMTEMMDALYNRGRDKWTNKKKKVAKAKK